jgi:hypothetical protein
VIALSGIATRKLNSKNNVSGAIASSNWSRKKLRPSSTNNKKKKKNQNQKKKNEPSGLVYPKLEMLLKTLTVTKITSSRITSP